MGHHTQLKDSPDCLNHNRKPSNQEVQEKERGRDLSRMGHMKMTVTKLIIIINSTYFSEFKVRVKIFRITYTAFVIFLPGYLGPSLAAMVNLSTGLSVL